MQHPSELEVEQQLRRLADAGALHRGIWLRVHPAEMDALPPSGWKLHISATPVSYAGILDRISRLDLLQDVPYKCIASIELLEELNDGRFGLQQAGKAITIYPANEPQAAALVEALVAALRGCPGPSILTDIPCAADAPVYYRFAPYDARLHYDALGRKQRLLQLPSGSQIVDTPHHPELPVPTLLPRQSPEDHLSFLRDDYLIVTVLHLSARGGVFIALPRRGAPRHPLIIKTARIHAQADVHGRDALWALQREHDTLAALQGTCGAPTPGEFRTAPDGRSAALLRPYLPGENLMQLWQSPDARTPSARTRLGALLGAVHAELSRLHDAGYLLRDLSPGNVLCPGDGVIFIDLELAHRLTDPAPPYRRGTSGFYDASRPRYASPTWQDDAYALLSLAHWLHTGVHPQWSRVSTHTGPQPIADIPVHPRFAADWQRAATAESAEQFRQAFAAVCASTIEPIPAPTQWLWQADAAVASLADHLYARTRHALVNPDPDAANVFTGISGLLLALHEAGAELPPESNREAIAPFLADSAALVSHIPGLYFGPPGMALALHQLGAHDTAKRMLMAEQGLSSEIPDLCHGIAGLLSALLHAHASTGDDDYLSRASSVGESLLTLARWMEATEGAQCAWAWPDGSYASLSGDPQYGFAHGVAGILAALSHWHEVAPGDTLADTIRAAVRFLAAGARPVADAHPGLWWSVSAKDETCWNAWSHGTPGVLKGLCAAWRAIPDAVPLPLLIGALEGIRAANNAGYCLCHGLASRLDAYVDAAHTLAADQPHWLLGEALADATALAALDLWAIEARVRPDAGDDGYGLLKGAAGALRTLLRFDRAFRSGAFLRPGGHPALDGQILAAQRFERGPVGRGRLHGNLLL